MTPVVIATPAGPCFAAYHPAPGPAVLVCPPFGAEAGQTARAWRALAGLLAARGMTRVFTEGGPSLADCFARLDLLDEVVVSTGPVPLGEPGRPAIGRDLREALDTRFRPIGSEMVGIDRIDAYERAGA